MATPRLTREALKFIKGMQDKHARQVLIKVLELASDPYPHDHKKLHGHPDLLRVDCGEYRIVYCLDGETLEIRLVGKRNDGEVYRQLSKR